MQDSQNALMNQFEGQNQIFGNNYNYGAQTNLGDYNQGQNNYGALFNALGNGQIGNNIGTTLPQYGGGQSLGGQQGGMESMPTISSATSDPTQIGQWLQAQASQPGADPILKTPDGIQYYTNAIISNGGLNPNNTSYWQNKSTLAQYGGAVGAGGGSGGGGLNGALDSARSGFQNFADTGGFSPQDIQDIRSRASSAVRSNFQTAQANLDQNRALQQFSPNYAAATANMARNAGYANSDALTNANASIAQMIQSGKLSGLQGLTGVSGLNMQGQQNNIQDMLGALSGSTNLYGATPGLTSTFGNQYGQSNNLLGNMQGNQNQLGLGLINSQINKSQIPGDTSQVISNIGSALKPIGQIGAAIATGGASLALPGGGLYGPGGNFGGG